MTVGIRAKVTRRVTKAKAAMANTSNLTEELLNKEREDARNTGRGRRDKSKDVVSSMEARVVRMETAVADIAMRLEEDVPSQATLEGMVEDLKGEMLGTLNSMADTLRQEFLRQLDQVFAELASFREEMKEMKGDWALCKEAAINRAHMVRGAPRIEAPRPKAFDGRRDAKELDTFLWNIERYLRHMGVEDDASKISTASLFLTDNALLWWRRRSCEIEQGTFTLETWDDFKKDIKLHFYPENARFEAKEKLRWLKQTGTVREYVAEYSNLLFEIPDISEEDKFVFFISGLQPWARQELQRRGVQNLSSAIAAAESLIEF